MNIEAIFAPAYSPDYNPIEYYFIKCNKSTYKLYNYIIRKNMQKLFVASIVDEL